MGMHLYLEIISRSYVEEKLRRTPKKLIGTIPVDCYDVQVMWYNAAQIYGWLVNNVSKAPLKNDKHYLVSKEQLEELAKTAKEVIACPETAEKKLPPHEDCIDIEINVNYFDQLKSLVSVVESMLGDVNFEEDYITFSMWV